ncbi:MAG: Gfo/Idh/MocA family oxidoreductase [Limnochordaceae bacterium]|nr:Gfo/Idh/MocA family oxidoreductase [Limnochordaceae bacterium]
MSVAVETVRVGVIGVGRRGSEHVQRLQRMRDELGVEVSAVCDIIAERAQRAAQETGARWFTNYREMLDSVPLDAVYVATPAPVHAECAVAVVQAGQTEGGEAGERAHKPAALGLSVAVRFSGGQGAGIAGGRTGGAGAHAVLLDCTPGGDDPQRGGGRWADLRPGDAPDRSGPVVRR